MWERLKKTYFNPPQLPILVSLSSPAFVTISLYGRVWQLRFSSESTSWWPFRSTGEFANLKDHRRAKTQLATRNRATCVFLTKKLLSSLANLLLKNSFSRWALFVVFTWNLFYMNDIKFEFEDRRHVDQMISV